MDLTIRPEELTRFEPSRLAVQQTLGGAWIDGFDRGIITIKINGHTGWRSEDDGGGGGEEAFQRLRAQSFTGWHLERAALIAAGTDPSPVTLVFVDSLNGYVDIVAPKSFTLRRSKSRPLLLMYSIEMLVLADVATSAIGLIGGGITNFGYLFGAAALAEAANAINGGLNVIGGALGL
jgi:hypothetical protein